MGAAVIATEEVEVTADLVRSLVSLGGYTHPLFADRGGPEGPPLPGQAVLLLLGGMVERSGCLDHARAMVALEQVSFRRMVRAGDRIHAALSLRESEPTTSGGGALERWSWRVLTSEGDLVLEADARMLVAVAETGEGLTQRTSSI